MAEIESGPACTLAPDALTQRLAEIRSLLEAESLSTERTSDGVTVRFRKTEATRAAVKRLIAAESDCCSFLAFDLSEESAALTLTIKSPPSFLSGLQRIFGADQR
jgi:hypothetical protein